MEQKTEYETPKQADVLDKIKKALHGLEYGEVTVKVQAGKVRIIERKEQEKVD
jgi:hypothetical protein